MRVNTGPYLDYDENNPDQERDINIQIDEYDTWSMDHTLALIILPMLKQLKTTKHGSPFVDDEDVPENIRSSAAAPRENEWDTDEHFHSRWEWVMDEMIWAFTQITDYNSENQFYSYAGNGEETMENFRVDREGLDKHEARINNALKLFGKYFRGLWD